jgi:hypothetical protein
MLNALALHNDLFPGFAFRQAGINGYCYDKVGLFGPEPVDVSACVRDFIEEFDAKTKDADWILMSVRWILRAYFVDHLAEMISEFEAAGYRVAVAGGAPEFYDSATFMRKLAGRHGEAGLDKPLIDAAFTQSLGQDVIAQNAQIRAIVEGAGGVYLDKFACSCTEALVLCDAVTVDLQPLRYDEAHWALAGAQVFAARMARMDWLAPLRGGTIREN